MRKTLYLLLFFIVFVSCNQKSNNLKIEEEIIASELKENDSSSVEVINNNILKTYLDGNFIVETFLDNPIRYHENGIISDLNLITKETNNTFSIYNNQTHKMHLSFFENGKLYMKSEFLGGQKHGEWVVCYKNSNVHYSSMYVDGSREGTWITYYENGKIWKSLNYGLDKLNGLSYVYSSDGKILFKGEYKKGIAVGNSNTFYENGEIEKTCHDGKDFRICRSFNENGEITSEVKYNLFTGKKISVLHYDEHGKISEEHFYNDDGVEIDNKSIIEIFDENGNKIIK